MGTERRLFPRTFLLLEHALLLSSWASSDLASTNVVVEHLLAMRIEQRLFGGTVPAVAVMAPPLLVLLVRTSSAEVVSGASVAQL